MGSINAENSITLWSSDISDYYIVYYARPKGVRVSERGAYLVRFKEKGFAFRITVPKELRGRYKSRSGKPLVQITEGLGTADPYKAEKLAAQRRAHWLTQFERARLDAPLTLGEIDDAARECFTATLAHLADDAEFMREVFLGKGGTPERDEAAWLEIYGSGHSEDLASGTFDRVKADIAAVERRYGVEMDPQSEAYTVLARALLRAKAAAVTGRMKVLNGELPETPNTFLGADRIDPLTLRPRPLERPKMRRTVEHGPFALFEQWVAKKKPAASSVNRWRAVFDDLQSKFGSKEITVADARAWAEALIIPERSERTVSEVWVNAARTVYGWAARQDPPLASNPFANVRIDVPEKIETRETPAFTKKEARTILRAASAVQPTSPFNAAKRWVPWLQAYSGARAGEITQLRGQDIQKEDGVWFMEITPLAGTTKTKKVRRIPLHQHLIEQGFLEFVRKRGKGPLFYSTDSKRRSDDNDPTNPVRSRAVKTRERLAAWVRELGVDDAAVSPTHGWRHVFKQIADSEDVQISERMSDWITGHAHNSEGAKYGKPTLQQLAKALAKYPRYSV